jgi:predicted nucleic acid-binding protein
VAELVRRGVVSLPLRLEEEIEPIQQLMERYSDVPMALADACLVRLSETVTGSTVLTLDNGFRVFRRHGRRVIPTRMPAPP